MIVLQISQCGILCTETLYCFFLCAYSIPSAFSDFNLSRCKSEFFKLSVSSLSI
uniref:Uncharacterized protein n=1 Tax=Rhizophora mucronata TaxID=61149 RepID=A0A2P2PPY2_RHIMU